MGSVRLRHSSSDAEKYGACSTAAEVWFTDSDGVDVLASLMVDAGGVPRELDVWKVDFSPLIRIAKELPPARYPCGE